MAEYSVDIGMGSKFVPQEEQMCLRCGEEYTVLGSNEGICPECGDRFVSLVGSVMVTGVKTIKENHDDAPLTRLYRVRVQDETERWFSYWISETADGTLRVARIAADASDLELDCQEHHNIEDHWLPLSLKGKLTERLLGDHCPEQISTV